MNYKSRISMVFWLWKYDFYIIKQVRDMELLSKVGRYEFLSEPFHCDYSSHLFMGHLGNHLLNAADFHSNDRGYEIGRAHV